MEFAPPASYIELGGLFFESDERITHVTFHIHRKLESETLYLPEIRPLIGKNVEIIVLEESPTVETTSGTGDWDDAMQAVDELEDYDFDALRKQHDYDLRHARDHLP